MQPATRMLKSPGCPALLAAALLLGGCAGGQSNESILGGFFENLMPPKPGEVGPDMFNVYDADKRRRAINLFANASWGGSEPYMNAYRTMLHPEMRDPDPTVRAAAIRALARHGGPGDVNLIRRYLRTSEPRFVRWEAAIALQRLHHNDAIEPLIVTVREDPEADVRAAAANALGQYAHPQVFQVLVGALHDEHYSVVTQAVQSLQTITGQRFGEDASRWLAWAEQAQDRFAAQQPYYYDQYVKPPSFLRKMKFWDPHRLPDPQQPTGVDHTQSTETAPEDDALRRYREFRG